MAYRNRVVSTVNTLSIAGLVVFAFGLMINRHWLYVTNLQGSDEWIMLIGAALAYMGAYRYQALGAILFMLGFFLYKDWLYIPLSIPDLHIPSIWVMVAGFVVLFAGSRP